MARSGIKVKRHGITVPEMEAKLRSGDAELNYCRGCLPRRLGLRSTSSAAVIRAKFNRFKPELQQLKEGWTFEEFAGDPSKDQEKKPWLSLKPLGCSTYDERVMYAEAHDPPDFNWLTVLGSAMFPSMSITLILDRLAAAAHK